MIREKKREREKEREIEALIEIIFKENSHLNLKSMMMQQGMNC